MSVNISREDYHKHHALSSGQIKDLAHSVRLWQFKKEMPMKPTAAMDLGTIIHMFLLEPEKAKRSVIMCEDLPRAGSKARLDLEFSFKLDNGLNTDDELFFVKQDEMKKISFINNSINESLAALELQHCFTEDGDSELPLFFNHVHREISHPGRALVDRLYRGANKPIIIDVKTSSTDLSEHALSNAASQYSWGIQDNWYRKAVETFYGFHDVEFVFLCVSTVAPFNVSLVKLNDETRKYSEEKVKKAFDNFQAFQRGEPEKITATLQEIGYPQWFLGKNK